MYYFRKGGEMMNRSIEVNGSEIYYYDSQTKGDTVVAVHGLTGNHLQLSHYRNLLEGSYRFISVDLKGRGNSAPATEKTGIEQHTQDILALLDALQIRNPILIGYSMGAFIMANIASRRHDVKALVLLDGAAECTPDHQNKIVEPSLGRISKIYPTADAYVEEVKNIYDNLGVKWSQELEEMARYEIKQIDAGWTHRSDEDKIRQDFKSFYTYKPEEVFTSIECPILLIHSQGRIGQMPPLFVNESYVSTMEAAKNIRKVDSETNHYTLVCEKQPEINTAIQTFFEKNL